MSRTPSLIAPQSDPRQRAFTKAEQHAFFEQLIDTLGVRPEIGKLVLLEANRMTSLELADRFHLPAIYPHQGYSDVGGLMSYAPNLDYNYYRVAAFVDKILRGANPAEMPIEQPANHELIVNRNTAKAIGLNLPADFLRRARRVIG